MGDSLPTSAQDELHYWASLLIRKLLHLKTHSADNVTRIAHNIGNYLDIEISGHQERKHLLLLDTLIEHIETANEDIFDTLYNVRQEINDLDGQKIEAQIILEHSPEELRECEARLNDQISILSPIERTYERLDSMAAKLRETTEGDKFLLSTVVDLFDLQPTTEAAPNNKRITSAFNQFNASGAYRAKEACISFLAAHWDLTDQYDYAMHGVDNLTTNDKLKRLILMRLSQNAIPITSPDRLLPPTPSN